jgi:hypothetical protein
MAATTPLRYSAPRRFILFTPMRIPAPVRRFSAERVRGSHACAEDLVRNRDFVKTPLTGALVNDAPAPTLIFAFYAAAPSVSISRFSFSKARTSS